MSKRKAALTQDDECFEFKSKLISTSTKKTIKINNFLKLIEDESRKMDAIRSPKFKLNGIGFSIDVYPDSDDSGFIGVFLHNYGNEDQTLSITVKEASGEEDSWEMEEVEAGDSWGFTQFLRHKNYREWAKEQGDVLKLEVVVTVHSKAEDFGWTRTKHMPCRSPAARRPSFASFGKTILEDDATTDFTIRCDTKNFRVHRNILCARSEVFRASILSPMKEAANGEIFIQDVGEKTLGTIINFIYTGELELGENPHILDLAWAGSKYLLPGFMELLALEVMKLDLSGEITASLLIAAHRHEAENLRVIALDKIRANRKILADKEFREMMKEADPAIMIDLLQDF